MSLISPAWDLVVLLEHVLGLPWQSWVVSVMLWLQQCLTRPLTWPHSPVGTGLFLSSHVLCWGQLHFHCSQLHILELTLDDKFSLVPLDVLATSISKKSQPKLQTTFPPLWGQRALCDVQACLLSCIFCFPVLLRLSSGVLGAGWLSTPGRACLLPCFHPSFVTIPPPARAFSCFLRHAPEIHCWF